MSRCITMIFVFWMVIGLAAGCGGAEDSVSPSPTPPAILSTATVPPPTATVLTSTPIPTPTEVLNLETTVICFVSLRFPEDEEGLRTQLGAMPGIETLIVDEDNTMTVTYDPTVIERSRIVLVTRNLGFSVIDEPCR